VSRVEVTGVINVRCVMFTSLYYNVNLGNVTCLYIERWLICVNAWIENLHKGPATQGVVMRGL
jgi:hypothetical protein